MKRLSLYIFLLLPTLSLSSSVWQKKIINYERSLYYGGLQNWNITQDKNGWIYVANTKGLIEFDGVYWNLYPMFNKTVRSLKIIDDKIFAGGSSQFGFYQRNNKGKLVYTSISNKMNVQWGGEIWNILQGKNIIYFQDESNVLLYKDSVITDILPSAFKIESSCIKNDILYLGTSNGIFFLDKDKKMKQIESAEALSGKKIISLLPFQNNILITTAAHGLYLFDVNNKSIKLISSIPSHIISQNQLFSVSTTGSKIILGTVRNGMFLIDLNKPGYIESFNVNSGIRNNTILSSFVDNNKNIWLGLEKGSISYIDLNSDSHPLFSKESPIGIGYCSMIYNGSMYFGTNQGLYKFDSSGNYQLINGDGQIWSLKIYDNSLFSSGNNGVTVITPKETYKINLDGVWDIHPIKSEPSKLIAGRYSGLSVLTKKDGRWSFSYTIPNFYESGRGLLEDDADLNFWLAGRDSIVRKISFDKSIYHIIGNKEYKLGGLFGDNPYFRKIDNNIVFCSLDGIYQYSRISDEFNHYAQLENMLEGPKYYDYLNTDRFNNIWFVSDKTLKMLPYHSGEYKKNIYNWGLFNEMIDGFVNVELIDSSSVIIGVDQGFYKIDFKNKIENKTNLNVFIKKITSEKDSILSYGISPFKLNYKDNSISIFFGATHFSNNDDIIYSYRLVGSDALWSIPSSNTIKEYTNLPEGKYQFEVKAFIRGEKDSENITSIEFEILPPWYKSIWAYIIYFVATLSFLFFLYKKTIDKQKKIISRNKEELLRQKKIHEEESRLKDQEIYKLQNENLKAELNYKTQELTGYMLNIGQKNEMLENVKKNAGTVLKAIDENKPVSYIKQKIIRLITLVNSNIEHDADFEIFKSNFDFVHKNFFKLLDEKHSNLTRNDKILCAYLKMNLSTKEIAPLLNISVRGVEVNRYRLRKKMNLDRDINLSEYLQTLE